MERTTKRVLASSIRIGDELSWFDAKAQAECTMVVTAVDTESFPGVQQLTLRKGERGRTRYTWNTKATAVMRVSRASK